MPAVPLARFRYVGPGDEIFVDFHWQPVTGEERELPEDTPLHPHLVRVEPEPAPAPPKPARKENA